MNEKNCVRYLRFLISIIWLLHFQSISAEEETINKGVNWLISQQASDGSWGKRMDLPTTAFSILALENSGLDVTGDKEHLTGITYSTAMELTFQYLATKDTLVYTKLQVLQESNGSWDDSISTTSVILIALSEAGISNPSAINYLKSSQDTADGSWQNSAYLTSLSLIALIKSGDTSESVSSGLGWLLHNQEPNGSWDRNLTDTSLALLALYLHTGHDSLISKGIEFIVSSVNPDGGFGIMPGEASSTYVTGVVLYGLSQYERTAPGIQDAINYLYANKNSDILWYEDSLSIRDTAETILTLLNLEATDSTILKGVTWLYNKNPKNTQDTSLRILALSESGISQGLDTILALQNPDGGFGISLGYLSQVDDTISALMAIGSIDITKSSGGIDYLIGLQKDDGGWGVLTDAESNVYITAMAASILQQFPRTTWTSTAINETTSYLISHQNPDGGFGNVYETSLAYLALLGVTTDTTVLGNATNYLTSTQLSSGSWDNDTYTTSLALRALHSAISPPPEPLTGTVTGKVIDSSTNQPLSGVSAVLQSDPRISAITDITGSFTLSNVPEGSQGITLSLSGYVPATITVEITAGSIIDIGSVPITPELTTGILKGTVTDAVNGQVLEGVTITVTGAFTGGGITDSQGNFIFTDVSPGEVTISASKTGYYSVTGTGTVTAGDTLFFNPVLSTTPPDVPTGTLTGKVLDISTNVPIQGAVISLSGGPSGTTDGQGVFLIKDITPATYQVTISRTGYISQTYQVMVMAGVTIDMQTVYLIPILQWTTVTGKVTDASTGNPIQDGEVTITGTNITTTTDSTGTYTISGITLLEFGIRSSAIGYDSKTYNVQTTTYGFYTIDFALNPSQISGLRVKSLIVDKQSYMANEDVLITVTIENTGGTETQALVLAEIQDREGSVIALVSPQDPLITLSPLGEIEKTIEWNTGQFQPAGYSIILKLTDPNTVGYTNPTGNVIAERSISIFILSTSAISGAISLSPPVTQVDMQTPITITSTIRNTGNIPVTANLILEASLNEVIIYTQESSVVNLQVNNIQNLDFGSFIPQEGGDYLITLKPLTPAVTSNISTILYVGPHATAEFTVTPEEAFPGDVQVKGNIHITGAGTATGTTQDPLVPLIKEAIQKGVNYTQPTVMEWHNRTRCYGCHVQTQAIYGLETSQERATVDQSVTRTLFDALRGWQNPNGSVGPGIGPLTETQLGLWAYTSWHDKEEAKPYILKSSDYLLARQASDGAWDAGFWGGWWDSRVSATAITMFGISDAYNLSSDLKYLTAITKAVQYLLPTTLVSPSDNMQMSHQIIALEAALSVGQDQTLRNQITNTINAVITQLKTNQRSDGGWGRYVGWGSDSLVTAQVLYALARSEEISSEDKALMDATVFLLNTQSPDGSWYSQNGIMGTRFATTTWVIISLPIAFERIGGVDTDLYLTLPDNVILDPLKPLPTDSDANYYHWKLLGVMEEGKDIGFDLTLKSLLSDEVRKVAQSATLTFTNVYTKETVTIPIDIPTVRALSPVSLDVSTDKSEYNANEDVNIGADVTIYQIGEIKTWTTKEDWESEGTTMADIDTETNPGDVLLARKPISEEGAVGIWRMDEGQGTTITDSSSYGNTGTIYGATWVDGKYGKALSFDGVDDYVSVPDSDNWDFTSTNGTVEFWIQADTLKTAALLSQINNDNNWAIYTYGNGSIATGRGGVNEIVSASGVISTGVWYYVTVVKNGSTTTIYVGGNSVVSGTIPMWTSSTNPLRIGGHVHGDVPYYFDGLIDEVRIYNQALSAIEIKEHYYGVHHPSGTWTGQFDAGRPVDWQSITWNMSTSDLTLAGDWHMDEGQGTTIADSSPNGNTGTISGATWADGKYGKALSFDGVDDYVKYPANNMPTGERTVGLWFYTTDTSANRQIFGYGGNNNNPPYSSFLIYFSSRDKRNITVHRHYPGGDILTYEASSPLTNAWHHLVFTTNSDGSRLYIDGQLVVNNSTVISTYVLGKDGFIGAMPGGSGVGTYVDANYPYFNGIIDEVTIYNRALTPEEVLLLYNTGTLPSLTSVKFRTRTADTQEDLLSATWSDYYTKSGAQITPPKSRWIEVEAVLETLNSSMTPILHSLTVGYAIEKMLEVSIEDSLGNIVYKFEPIKATDFTLGQLKHYDLIWNTGTTLAGDYKVHAVLKEGDEIKAEDYVPFTILAPDVKFGVTSTVATDKISYNPNQDVTIISKAQSQAINWTYTNLMMREVITSPTGEIVSTQDKSILTLLPGQDIALNFIWNTANNIPGNYTVTQNLITETGETIDTKTASFTIESTAETGKGISGTIEAIPTIVSQPTFDITTTVTNQGNVILTQVLLEKFIIDPDTKEQVRAFTETIDLAIGETKTATVTGVPIQGLSAKDYMLILNAIITGNLYPLATGHVHIEIVPLVATIRIEPESFNNNTGEFTAFVQFPEGFDASTIRDAYCDGAPGVNYNYTPGLNQMIIKFNRDQVTEVPLDTHFVVRGTFGNNLIFEGSDDIMKVVE